MMLCTSKFTFVYFRAVFGVFAASMVALTLVCAMVSKMFATFYLPAREFAGPPACRDSAGWHGNHRRLTTLTVVATSPHPCDRMSHRSAIQSQDGTMPSWSHLLHGGTRNGTRTRRKPSPEQTQPRLLTPASSRQRFRSCTSRSACNLAAYGLDQPVLSLRRYQ